MIFRPCLRLAPLLALSALPALAQPSEERSRAFDILSQDSSEWYVPKSTVSVGLRVLSAGPSVDFGNLGNVPSLRSIPPSSDGNVDRVYDDGVVAADAPRLNEVDSSGNQTSTPGGRYQTTTTVDGVTRVTGDFVSYTPGQTRLWGYRNQSQATTPGQVAFHTYRATSEGATASDEQGMTGGVDVQLARSLGKGTGRFQFSLVAGVALTDINAKTNGTVASTLHTRTDTYALVGGGSAPAAPYTGPSFTDFIDNQGNTVSSGFESTPPISQTISSSTETSVAGAASVQGNWQIKGAYFLLRLGPSIRTKITNRFGLSASAGVAGAYTGSKYMVTETIVLPDVAEPVTVVEEDTATEFLSGFYADVNVDWMLNERTGLFGGVSMQQLGDYDQSVGGRTAKVDMGNAIGFRGGINIKF
ncbi:MAG TPA: hypothetical protein VEB66_13390 [Opitutaceae bacterium]|nr:hypothetical protein [Opitutaceae bacterium]